MCVCVCVCVCVHACMSVPWDVCDSVLLTLGLFTIRFPEMMLKPEAKKLYSDWLAHDCEPVNKIQVHTATTLPLATGHLS